MIYYARYFKCYIRYRIVRVNDTQLYNMGVIAYYEQIDKIVLKMSSYNENDLVLKAL